MKKDLKAYCNSFNCTKSVVAVKMVRKMVSIHAINCPDCGCVLFWGEDQKRYQKASGKTKGQKIVQRYTTMLGV